MHATASSPGLDDADAYTAGRYLTDGVHLYRLLEPLEEDARHMTGVEDCASLEIVLVPAGELLRRMRPVVAGSR